jgi:hypothetical protein
LGKVVIELLEKKILVNQFQNKKRRGENMSKNKKAISKKSWLTGLLLMSLTIGLTAFISLSDNLTKVSAQNGTATTIYDNGPLSTGPMSNSGVAAPSGFEWSEVQNETGNTTYSNTLSGVGCGVSTSGTFRCADDFVVPSGQTWTIDNVIVFAYQTGFAGGTSPITAATLRIWDGVPGDLGSNIIFGDATTNRLGTSTDSSLYRIFNSAVPAPGTTPGTTRRIWRNSINVSPGLTLPAGTYWVDWATQIGTNTTHFAPPTTIPGVRTQAGWNARQFNPASPGTWGDVIDVGNPDPDAPDVPLDFPFKLVGSVGSGNTQPPQVDFDGDGKSDYSIVRDNTPPGTATLLAPAGRRSIKELEANPGFKPLQPVGGNSLAPANHGTNLGWYISNSGSNTARVQGFGQPATDFWVPEDYDGDGQDDIAVWRGIATSGPGGGFFYTFTSSNSTVNEIDFGVIGDNPTVVGDYDGDGIADPAVYRQPGAAPFGPSYFYFRGSNNNQNGNITYVQWGNNVDEDLRPYPGDFDGDGKNDFCIFRTNPDNTNQGQYVLLRSSDGGIEYINWGQRPQVEPVLAPGDYDGDGKTDFMNVRLNGSSVQWWLLDRNGNQSTTTWGAVEASPTPAFDEFIAQGDFDGDGSTDIGVWRRDNNSNSNSFFYTLRSSDGMLQTFEWGSANDAPVPGWNAN